jgi:hypothetical protein
VQNGRCFLVFQSRAPTTTNIWLSRQSACSSVLAQQQRGVLRTAAAVRGIKLGKDGACSLKACSTLRPCPCPSCQSSDPLRSHCTTCNCHCFCLCLCTSSTTTATASGRDHNCKSPHLAREVWLPHLLLTRPLRNSFVLEKRTPQSHSRDDQQQALTKTSPTIIHTHFTRSLHEPSQSLPIIIGLDSTINDSSGSAPKACTSLHQHPTSRRNSWTHVTRTTLL